MDIFEYDPNKSDANKGKHGIDFQSAKELWKDPNRLIIPAKRVDEDRFLLIAKLEDVIWAVIYTYRKKNIRIILVRKARDHEKELYIRS